MTRHQPPGWAGWAATGAVIVLAEATCRETLTEAYRAAPPAVRVAALGGWLILLAHLHGILPTRFDPFCLYGPRGTSNSR